MTLATATIHVSPAVLSVAGIDGFRLSGCLGGQAVVAQWATSR